MLLWFTLPEANAGGPAVLGRCLRYDWSRDGIVSVTVQYGGALRAWRLGFKQLLEGVVRATMLPHDILDV